MVFTPLEQSYYVPVGKRVYTVAEIDQMRDALISKHWTPESRLGYNEACEFAERELRTYLMAGVDPQQVIDRKEAIRMLQDRLAAEQQAHEATIKHLESLQPSDPFERQRS